MKRIKLVKLLSGREMSHLLNIVTLTCNWKPTWWPIGCRVANQHLRLLRFWLEGSSGAATGGPMWLPHSKIPQAVLWLEGSNRPASGLANGMHGVLRSVAWDGDLPPRGMNSRSPLSPPPGWCPWKKNGVLTHDVYVENSVVDPDQDSRGSVDPDSQSGSGLGSKRAKITHKIEGS